MARGKMVRVSPEGLEKARELLAGMEDRRFAPGENQDMTDRRLLEMGMGWLCGRLEGEVWTTGELDAAVMRTLCNVLGEHLGRRVNGVVTGGQFTLSWEQDGARQEVTGAIEA